MQSLGSLSDSDDENDDNEEETDDTETGTEESTSNEPEECVDCGVNCGDGDEGPPSNNLETLLNHTLLEDSADTMNTTVTQKELRGELESPVRHNVERKPTKMEDVLYEMVHSSGAAGRPGNGMKWAIFEKRSTTTQITEQPEEMGRSIVKSITMCCQEAEGIERGDHTTGRRLLGENRPSTYGGSDNLKRELLIRVWSMENRCKREGLF
ncbi:unnamed protein product [Ranitomeya imitator]|uniref:Uncharacterized protein n=1 Tax=Ranitomeya imitator TaxID=111125 RepID=A0ABN9LEE4_9NEOB|nr:unnamed protein product [Ranitomeya imitator]